MNSHRQRPRALAVEIADHGVRGRMVEGFTGAGQGAKNEQQSEAVHQAGRHGGGAPQQQGKNDQVLTAEHVAQAAGDGNQHGVDPEERGPEQTKLHIGKPQLILEQRKHGGEHHPIGMVQEIDHPEQCENQPFV